LKFFLGKGDSMRRFLQKNLKERTAFPSFRKKIGGFQFASVLVRMCGPILKKLLALMK
jgi:hypothetical protein